MAFLDGGHTFRMRLPIGTDGALVPVIASTLGRLSLEMDPFGWSVTTVVRFYANVADLQQRLECAPCRMIQLLIPTADQGQNIFAHLRPRLREALSATDL